MAGRLSGKLALVTAAAQGIGAATARAFAAEGARVVVNDVRRDAAEAVVAEIKAKGGQALANDGDITTLDSAERIVAAACEAFGEVDVLVNNAGVCRDRMFVSLTEADWDDVMRVHLKGHFCMANVLARRWRDASKAGKAVDARIINTSSGAGLQGSLGQSNYSAAKAGIAALTLVQAVELARYGITANGLAPVARTGMTESVFADMMKKPEGDAFDRFDPANVAPLLVWLGSAASRHVTGRMFEAAGGMIGLADGWRSGVQRDKGARWQPAEVGDAVAALIAEARPAQKVFGT
ncbi:MAG: SDR family oxidoreductase [Noviherbaspirillum sp.]